ncbi:MAG TPA: phosphoribosyltransferase family protein [Gemmatimonadaceae bacterium]|nr:phosphoribosyltransferase family protein [Gemmatimonadaceae bacterium]
MNELKDRRAALAGAFTASAEARQGKSVLLLDDLYRSGASMEEAARAIRKSGAKAVYALALTRTRTKR